MTQYACTVEDPYRRWPASGVPHAIGVRGDSKHRRANAACEHARASRHARQGLWWHGPTIMPSVGGTGQGGLGLGVLQSANLSVRGRPVVFNPDEKCSRSAQARQSHNCRAFWRELARPAGFEPATLGLEGPVSDRLYQAVIFTECFRGRFRRKLAPVRPLSPPHRLVTITDGVAG